MLYDFPQQENKILDFWKKKKILKKFFQKNKNKKPWSFLDGPITANNPMGVHHAWGRTYKDLFQRYKAMRGYDERFQNGFDCQGLWVEVEVEKELGFKTKREIENYGIAKFVEKCKERVRKYSQIQTQQSIRLGQWMDWENSYYTMSDENNYMIWYFLKKCWEKGLLYKGRDAVPWCPRCGTAISQHEILTEEYKIVQHKAIYFKLPILNKEWEGTNFLVWTTTPWTIPGNVALLVHPFFEYGIFQLENGERLILLKDLAEKILKSNYNLIETVKGERLKGLKYEGVFDALERVEKAKRENPDNFHIVILDKNLVTAEEGTGIVHIAPAAGQEDFHLAKIHHLPIIEIIDESAVYLEGLGEFSGKNAKEHPEIILDYIENTENKKFFFGIEDYQHRYPTCWRCKKELVWRMVDEWYISMEKLREKLIKIAKRIEWIPSFGLAREIDWLKNMDDWLISKKRYWGLALPIFECKCGNFEVIGSKEELKERAVEGWKDFQGHSPHRPWVDKVKIKCSRCGELIKRIPDVGNPWLDAGIVPFSTFIDPITKRVSYLTDRKYWKRWFPADLVCESFPGQFRNWFYSIIVMSAVLEGREPVKTIFGYASVRDEKGEEMHKSKGNAIWFDEAVEKVGADPMRWLYARQNPAENLNFGYTAIEEIKKKLMTLYNSYNFFFTYVERKERRPAILQKYSKDLLDQWIISRINNLIKVVESCLDKYQVAKAISAIEEFFIEDLSLWYIRRSRPRFKEKGPGRTGAIATLYYVLLRLLQIISPIVPFFAEALYQQLKLSKMPRSIHLMNWPKVEKRKIKKDLEVKMQLIRQIVSLALAERATKGIKIRQPLLALKVKNKKIKRMRELWDLIRGEVNVKEIIFDETIDKEVELDTTLTPELEEEGLIREMVRQIQDMRKSLGLRPVNKIFIFINGEEDLLKIIEKKKDLILKNAKANKVVFALPAEHKFDLERKILEKEGKELWVAIKKVD